jgi:hypothetical protein
MEDEVELDQEIAHTTSPLNRESAAELALLPSSEQINFLDFQTPPLRELISPDLIPPFLSQCSELLVYRIGSGFLAMYEKSDLALLKKIERRKEAGEDMNRVLSIYLSRSRSEVLVQLVYGKRGSIKADAVLQFKERKKDEKVRVDQEKLRMRFVVELLKRHLFCVFERSKVDDEVWHIEIYAPFSTLAHECERLNIGIRLS